MADKRLSLRGLAKLLGMSHSQLSLTFSGDRRLQIDEATQLASVFGEPLHKIIEAAGISVPSMGLQRVPVVGYVKGDGTVAPVPAGSAERTVAPEGVPADGIALQWRTALSPLEWVDGMVSFCAQPSGISASVLGRLAYIQIEGGPAVVGMLRRGYKDKTHNIAGTYHAEDVTIEWATPLIYSRH